MRPSMTVSGQELPAEKRPSRKKGLFGLHKGIFPTNHGVCDIILAAPIHHPPVLSYLLTRRKRQSVVHRWVRVAEVRRVGPLVYSGLIFVSDFYTGGVAAEDDNCILLEIMIIVISFTTQIYCTTYCSTLSPGAFGYGAPWWPWNGAGRRHWAYSRHLVSFFSDLCVILLPRGPRP